MPSFGPYRLDLEAEQLYKGAKQLVVRRKPMAILRFLVANPRRLVTHEELLANVWGGAVVSESAVRSHLHELRQVLGEGVIETVIGRGYRFAATLDADAPPAYEPAPTTERVVVGREAERSTLRAAFARARENQRQICFVTGEPGIGKTTLVESFCDELPADVLVLRGTYVEQFTAPEAYFGIIDMLQRTRNTRHADRVSSALVRVAPTLLAQIPQLIPESKHDEVMRRAMTATEARIVRELMEAIELLAQQPLVLVLEDLQWSDVATIDLLGMLGQRRELARLLVIATSRRAEANTVTHPLNRVMRTLVARHGTTPISLEPISSAAIQQLLDRRFGAHDLPPALGGVIDRITGGTPLFLVAALDDLTEREMLVERDGRWRLAVSLEEVATHRADSVLQLIDMQLDRLSEQEQRALEAASIVGPEFAIDLCAAALEMSPEAIDDLCDSLVRRGVFLRREGTEEWPDGTIQPRYGFLHGLVFQVCHDRVSAARRQRWHRLVADRLERAYGTNPVEVAHRLATHFEHARSLTQAIRYYVMAGERTAHRYASTDAHKIFTHAFELLHRTPESPERDALELEILGGMSPAMMRTLERISNDDSRFQRMIELTRRLDNGPRSYTALANLAVRHTMLAEYDRSFEICAQMEQIASETPLAMAVLGYGAAVRACNHLWVGEAAPAIDLLSKIIGSSDSDDRGTVELSIFGPTDGTSLALVYLTTALFIAGRPDEALRAAETGLARSRAIADPYSVGLSLMNCARVCFLRGDPPADARRYARECVAMEGAVVWHPATSLIDRWSRCVEEPLSTDEADRLSQMMRFPRYPMATTMQSLPLVAALSLSKLHDRARAFTDELLAFAIAHRERVVEAELLRMRGELDPEPAPWFHRALAVARELAQPIFEQRAAASLASLA